MRPERPAGDRTVGVAVVAATADVLAGLPHAAELLTDQERGRMTALRRGTDRLDFVAAHALVRLCSASLFGTPLNAAVVQQCDQCGQGHGAPRLQSHPGVGLSLSHASGRVAAAASSARVGVDLEPLSHAPGAAEVLDTFSTASERAALRAASDPALGALLLWVRKEALIKAGVGDLSGMASIDLGATALEPPTSPRRLSFGRHLLLDLCPSGLAAAACVASLRPVRLASLPQLITSVVEREGSSRPPRATSQIAADPTSTG